jgi:hypothetical protein
VRRLVRGGSLANEQLTSVVAAVLVPLLAAEGATLLNLTGLLTVHAFIGMMLIPIVVIKLCSTGWRMVRYYRRVDDYVLRGAPHLLLRVVVAPVLVTSTIVLFGTGVALLVRDQTAGMLVALHKAGFLVWLGATSVHVLARAPVALRALRRRISSARVAVATFSIVAGFGVAMLTLPAADHLQDRVSAHVGVDAG